MSSSKPEPLVAPNIRLISGKYLVSFVRDGQYISLKRHATLAKAIKVRDKFLRDNPKPGPWAFSPTLKYGGQSYTVIEVMRMTGLSRPAIEYRRRHGWSPEQIIEIPSRQRRGTNLKAA